MATTFGSLPADNYLKTLKTVFMNEIKKVNNYIDKLYDVQKTDMYTESDQSFAGLGVANTWSGEDTVSYETAETRYKTTLTQTFYRKAAKFTWLMRRFERYGLMRDIINSLAKMMELTKQIYGVSFFVNQLAGSDGNYWNATAAKYLFSATHALANGSTYSNVATSGAALSVTTLQTGIANMFKTPDDQGHVMGIRPIRLWVAPDGYANAIEVVNKGIGLRSDTAENTKNAFDIIAPGLDIVACEHLTDTDGWFLQGDYTKTVCRVSTNMEQNQWEDDSDHSVIHDAICGLVVGSLDWRGFYGSRGA